MSEDLTPKEQLQKKADELNIDYNSNHTKAQLKEMIAEAEMEDDKPKKKSKPKKKKVKAKKGVYYWIKVPTYLGNKKTIARGLYHFKSKVKRLEKSSRQYVEKYEGKIPQARLMEIAETLGVETENEKGDYRDSKDLLEEIVIEK